MKRPPKRITNIQTLNNMAKLSPQKAFKTIIKDVRKVVSKAPRAVGRIAVNHFEENFEKGGFVDNTLEKWDNRKDNKDPGRGILIGKQSGRLMRSIRVISATRNGVIVGTSLPYARIHNRGGTINHPGGTAFFIKDKRAVFVRNKTAARYRQLHKKDLPRTRAHKITIPQRRFLGPSYQLNLKIARWYLRQFNLNLK